ncbi:hypothetical protein LX36DRAFT_726370 [Colletotrichum falcatum]|nr:hypothetical protein LX36DRAFT_726370 [Colletotrichum falcatum]
MEATQISTSNCNAPADGAPNNDNISDSGYGSRFSTPNEGEGGLEPKMSDTQPESSALDVGHWPRKRKLRVFETDVPESAIAQLQDWKVLFSGQLWESVSKAAPATSYFDISMKLKHLGTNEADSRLYLVFFCDKRLAKHVRRFVTQRHVLEEMRGQFIPQVIPQGPMPLYGEEVYTSDKKESSCGIALYYFVDNAEKGKSRTPRVGTLGGIVKVSFPEKVMFYGLTTRHLFEAVKSSIAKSPEEDEESEEDWDEIQLDHELSSSLQESSTSNTGLFHEEVPVRHRDSPKYVSLLGIRQDLRSGRNIQVLVITNHGDLTGSLRHCGSSVIARRQSMRPMDVYDLSLTGSRLLHGDSGSWVVDFRTRQVIGHVIASDVLSEAYVLPMAEILQQIRDLGDAQDVEIATSDEIMAYNGARHTATYYGDHPDGFGTDHGLFDRVDPGLRFLSHWTQRSGVGSRNGSSDTDSTLPTVYSFDEDAEAAYRKINTTAEVPVGASEEQHRKKYVCNVSGCTCTQSLNLDELGQHMSSAHPDGSSAGPR